jgi:predicted nuclease with TOPRIM domain
LNEAQDELEKKQSEVTELHGKVVNIRSHALKLEDELRGMNSGKSSNVQRVNELQQEVQIQKKNAGAHTLARAERESRFAETASSSGLSLCTGTA